MEGGGGSVRMRMGKEMVTEGEECDGERRRCTQKKRGGGVRRVYGSL